MSSKKRYVVPGLLALLVLSNVIFIFKSISLSNRLSETEARAEVQERNDKVVAFMNLFVEKVLNSESEVDFDTRLALENSVRATGDEELLEQWQKFTDSRTEAAAQTEVKNLLAVIAQKMR